MRWKIRQQCSVVIVIELVSLLAVAISIRPFVMTSESMKQEVPKNSLVLLDTHAKFDEIKVGQNVVYLLGNVYSAKSVTIKSSLSTSEFDEIMCFVS